MKTQYYTATSIDGFIADADNSLEWLFHAGEGDSEAAQVQASYPRFIADVGAVAMGSTTYEWVLDHVGADDEPGKWPYSQPTWVFSTRSLAVIGGADIRLVSGDVAAVHAEMVEAAEGRNVWLVGGGDLVGQFHDHGLLDELILGMAPVFLGSGAPLLPRRILWPTLKLREATPHGESFVTLRYEVTRDTDVGP
jgi:dihydrofolate reductase